MIKNTLKAFLYGFILYAGIPALMDIPFYLGTESEPLWGLTFALMFGAVGGATFIVSFLSFYTLRLLFKELINSNG